MSSVLYVSDLQLGFRGLKLVKHYYPSATPILWNRGDIEGRKKARETIRSGDWDITLSFFNDLIFKVEDLAHMRIPLNIHPSKPDLPGVAYDTIPLLREDQTYGVTLHRMTECIDQGSIYEVIEANIHPHSSYLDFRSAVHRLSLDMLAKTLKNIKAFDSLDLLEAQLTLQANQTHYNWADDYWNYARVAASLKARWQDNPNHPIFDNHPDYRQPAHLYKLAPHDRRLLDRPNTAIGEQLDKMKGIGSVNRLISM